MSAGQSIGVQHAGKLDDAFISGNHADGALRFIDIEVNDVAGLQVEMLAHGTRHRELAFRRQLRLIMRHARLLENALSPYYMPIVRHSQWPHHLLAEAIDFPVPREGDQRHLPALPRLEPHRGAGRDVEAHAAGFLAVELQRRIGLEEMIMRADLDRPVARVDDRELPARPAGISNDLAALGDDFAGDHGRRRPLGNPLRLWKRERITGSGGARSPAWSP